MNIVLLKEQAIKQSIRFIDNLHIFALGGAFSSIAAIPQLMTGVDVYGHAIPTSTYVFLGSVEITLICIGIGWFIGNKIHRL